MRAASTGSLGAEDLALLVGHAPLQVRQHVVHEEDRRRLVAVGAPEHDGVGEPRVLDGVVQLVVVLGFVVAGVINAVVNKDAVARYLGGNLVLANILGATIGVVTLLCCCSAIATAMALYRAGSRRGPACAFLIATPCFNWYGLIALLIVLSPAVALAVAGSAAVAGFGTGLVIDLVGPHQAPDTVGSSHVLTLLAHLICMPAGMHASLLCSCWSCCAPVRRWRPD